MSGRGGLLFTGFLAAAVGAGLLAVLDLGPLARRVPLWVLGPTLGLLALQLGLDLTGTLRRGRARAADLLAAASVAGDAPSAGARGITPGEKGPGPLGILAWVLALPIAIGALGLLVALPLSTLLYLRLRAGESWRLGILTAAGLLAVLWGAVAAGVAAFPAGWVVTWLTP